MTFEPAGNDVIVAELTRDMNRLVANLQILQNKVECLEKVISRLGLGQRHVCCHIEQQLFPKNREENKLFLNTLYQNLSISHFL